MRQPADQSSPVRRSPISAAVGGVSLLLIVAVTLHAVHGPASPKTLHRSAIPAEMAVPVGPSVVASRRPRAEPRESVARVAALLRAPFVLDPLAGPAPEILPRSGRLLRAALLALPPPLA